MKTEVRFGVLFGLLVVVYVLIEHVLGFNTTRHDIGQYSRLMGVIVPFVGIFFGIRQKREKDLGGYMTWGQGVKTGFQIALIQTTITTLWFLLYGNVINPDFMDTMLAFERSKMAAAGTSDAAIAQQVEQIRSMYAVPGFQVFQMIAGIVSGVIAAMIFSAFMKKKEVESKR